ncbi:MAG TPA: hypothetical protein PKY30_12730 [Myxococcota bacterium]|nr:hypothetical protein [Myxococcota bacterium]
MDQTLPSWATQLRNRYLSGESSVFLLHGNVRDVQPWMEPDGKVVYLALRDFLTRFLGRSKEPVVHYNVSEGLEFGAKGQAALFKKAINLRRTAEGRALVEDLPFSPGLVLPILEDLITDPTQRAGVVVDYLEMIAPNGDLSFLSEPDKANLVTLQRLGGTPASSTLTTWLFLSQKCWGTSAGVLPLPRTSARWRFRAPIRTPAASS